MGYKAKFTLHCVCDHRSHIPGDPLAAATYTCDEGRSAYEHCFRLAKLAGWTVHKGSGRTYCSLHRPGAVERALDRRSAEEGRRMPAPKKPPEPEAPGPCIKIPNYHTQSIVELPLPKAGR